MAKRGIAVVGPCASGKTTIVAGLREAGYDAYAVAQEHSGIADLWKHLKPEFLVHLEVDLASVRKRRGNPAWPAWLYNTQLTRLSSARAHSDIDVNTVDRRIDEIIQTIAEFVDSQQRDTD